MVYSIIIRQITRHWILNFINVVLTLHYFVILRFLLIKDSIHAILVVAHKINQVLFLLQNLLLNIQTFHFFNLASCQVTAQSYVGMCLGRLCYPGTCDGFLSSMNQTFTSRTTSTLAMIHTIRSSLSSFVKPPRIVWPVWKDRSYLPIRYSILILLLIANFFFTLITLFIVIKSIRQSQILAARKLHRYSLF